MGVSVLGWVLTTVVLVVLLAVDLLVVSRRKDAITPAGAARWIGLYVGLALVAAGSAAVHAFNWLFYLFGAFLVYTAVRLLGSLRDKGEEEEKPPGIALLSRLIPRGSATRSAAHAHGGPGSHDRGGNGRTPGKVSSRTYMFWQVRTCQNM